MPEQKFTEYTTESETRWDLVAHVVYGNAMQIDDLIKANPGLPADVIIPAGSRLRVPIKSIRRVDNALLPPWKR